MALTTKKFYSLSVFKQVIGYLLSGGGYALATVEAPSDAFQGTGNLTLSTDSATQLLQTSTPALFVIVQNDPSSTIDVYIGSSAAQNIRMVPGQSISLGINNANKIYVRRVANTASPRVNWIAL